jgi:hypothetical protein
LATGIAIGATAQNTEFTQGAWSGAAFAGMLPTNAVDVVDVIDCSQALAAPRRAQGQANGSPSGNSWPQRARSAISLSDVVGIG